MCNLGFETTRRARSQMSLKLVCGLFVDGWRLHYVASQRLAPHGTSIRACYVSFVNSFLGGGAFFEIYATWQAGPKGRYLQMRRSNS